MVDLFFVEGLGDAVYDLADVCCYAGPVLALCDFEGAVLGESFCHCEEFLEVLEGVFAHFLGVGFYLGSEFAYSIFQHFIAGNSRQYGPTPSRFFVL